MRKCLKVAASRRRIPGAIRSLQLERARVLHETLLVPVLMYGTETMIYKKEGLGLGLHR